MNIAFNKVAVIGAGTAGMTGYRAAKAGGKQTLLGISKRGDTYLRTLLIHGARAVLQSVRRKHDVVSCWASRLLERRNSNIAAVALANKNTSTVWALLTKNQEYCPWQYVCKFQRK